MKPTKREGTNIMQEQGTKDMHGQEGTNNRSNIRGGDAQTGEGVNEMHEHGVAKGTDQQTGEQNT